MREKLASRLGFLLLSAACAIGLGNVWRFPYVVGKNGGGWFVLLYLVALALIGIPVLVMEFAVGRAAQRSLMTAHAVLTPGKKAWQIHGWAGFAGGVLLMMFYTTVTGWMLIYFIRTACGVFEGFSPEVVGAAFGVMLENPAEMTTAMLVVTIGSMMVCLSGLQRGVERITKYLMVALLVLVVALAVNSVLIDARNGGSAGLKFYLVPDFARMRSVGFFRVLTDAMNQSFFTLSIGVGTMAIFGSYIGRERSLLGEAINVAALDTIVAIAAGIIILPACLAYGINPGQGPGLVFVTLPAVFNNMPLGRLWGGLFFAFMSCAALTTVIAVFEFILANLMDRFGWTRAKSALVIGVAMSVLGLPCILGFNCWREFTPLGPGSTILDLEDFCVSNLLLPLGSLTFAFYCTRRYGWGWKNFLAETNAGAGLKFPGAKVCRIYCAYVLPVIIVSLMMLGIYDRFR